KHVRERYLSSNLHKRGKLPFPLISLYLGGFRMSISDLQKKLEQFEQEFTHTQQAIKKLLSNKQQVDSNNLVYCYFNHSLILEHEKNSNHLILGNLYVKNESNQPKDSPIILIKVTSEDNFNFSGKFYTGSHLNQHGFQWKRIKLNNLYPKTHFCFKPTDKEYLSPDDRLTFQNFQIKIPLNSSIIVEGFVYFNQSN